MHQNIYEMSNVSCAHNKVNLENNGGHNECTLQLTLQGCTRLSRKCHRLIIIKLTLRIGGHKECALYAPNSPS